MHLTSDGASGYGTGLLWGWANYRFCDAFNVQAGLFSLPGTRAWWLDERGLPVYQPIHGRFGLQCWRRSGG